MKQLLFVLTVLCATRLCADSFTDILQDLAMQTACLGKYSNTEAGEYNIPDPHDYYTPEMMAKRFSQMSGNRTKIDMFYGICFDYAHAAWDDIKRYQADYNNAGMRNQEWYIAAVDDNPNYITLYDPIPEVRVRWNGYSYIDSRDGEYLQKLNGVYCKKRQSYNVSAHGDNTTYHAWLWVQKTDGTWYWIDPTWTDTMGYVWYGYVSGGKEIKLMPEMRYCVITPPSPHIADNKPNGNTFSYNYYDWKDDFGGFSLNFSVPNLVNTFENIITLSSLEEYDIGICIDVATDEICGGFGFNYIHANEQEGFLTGIFLGPRITNFLGVYAGGEIGISLDPEEDNSESNKVEQIEDFFSRSHFAYKVHCGAMIPIESVVAFKIDASWNNIYGFSFGAGVSIGIGY